MRKLVSPGAPMQPAQEINRVVPPAQAASPTPSAGAVSAQGWGASTPRVAAPSPTSHPQTAIVPPPVAPAGPAGWGATALAPLAAQAAPQQAVDAQPGGDISPAPPSGIAYFSKEVQAQVMPEGAIAVEWAGRNAAPFDGGQPVLAEPPQAVDKPASRKSNKKEPGRADSADSAPPDYGISFDVGTTLRAILESGASLDAGLDSLGAIIDHIRGKE